MSKGLFRPNSIAALKRHAKRLKQPSDLTYAEALDLSARAAGFENYAHALKGLTGAAAPAAGYAVFISVAWRVRETCETGQEILRVQLDQPLEELVKPGHLKQARHLSAMRFAAPDHLDQRYLHSSQSAARRDACAAARTLAFMQATGLRPSSSRNRAYPRGSSDNAMPRQDHASRWFDPGAKAFVLADEPYDHAGGGVPNDRQAWAERFGWTVVKPAWRGLYNPDGGCVLYLAADAGDGYRLDRIEAALNRLPPPFVEADWNGVSAPILPPFFSPDAEAQLAAKRTAPVTAAAKARLSGPRASERYRFAFGQARSRPKAHMPVEAHAEVGKLLKSALIQTFARKGVYNRVNGVRSELDNWAQCEFGPDDLPGPEFFDLYYHEDSAIDGAGLTGPALRARQRQNLEAAKRVLTRHYPDCAPLRALLKQTDAAIQSLETWQT